jgi:hypothetical protein
MKNRINNVSLDVQINGKSTKQFTKDSNFFVIAHENAEYELFIKNENFFRVLAILGCDGINVVDGNKNTINSTGYVIEGNSSLRLKGFRISDDEVAAFKFTKKKDSYATEKVGSEAQCGVISLSCYRELEKPEPVVIKEYIPYYPTWPKPWNENPYRPTPIWYYGDGSNTFTCSSSNKTKGRVGNNNFSRSLGGNIRGTSCFLNSMQSNTSVTDVSYSIESAPSNHFDMGSSFGDVKESKVTTVNFERGNFMGEINIYYASKESLISMGVNLTNESKIVFPQGIDKKYCSPPINWKK